MSVGLLIITHNGIGPSLLGTATFMLGNCPLRAKLLTASRDCDPDELIAEASEEIKSLDNGEGVLVLTDLYGSTPSNIAGRLCEGNNVSTVTGLNLSMLIRVLNYPELGLEGLAEKAYSGARDGIKIINNKRQ